MPENIDLFEAIDQGRAALDRVLEGVKRRRDVPPYLRRPAGGVA